MPLTCISLTIHDAVLGSHLYVFSVSRTRKLWGAHQVGGSPCLILPHSLSPLTLSLGTYIFGCVTSRLCVPGTTLIAPERKYI